MPSIQTNDLLLTSDDTPTQAGDTFALPTDSVVVVDVEARAVMVDGSLSKVFNLRRVLHNEADSITAGAPVTMVPPAEVMGALAASVAIEYTGTTGRIEVTGPDAEDVKWEVERQVSVTYAQSLVDILTALSASGLWIKGDYTAGTWAGTASAGTSGSRDLDGGSNYPDVVDGAPDFDAANDDRLLHTDNLDDLFTAGGGTVLVIARADSAVAHGTYTFTDPPLFNDYGNGSMGLYFTTSGVTAMCYDGAEKTRTLSQGTGSFFMAAMRWDGSYLKLRVNETDATPLACGNQSGLSSGLPALGKSYGGPPSYFDGEMRLVVLVPSALSDGTLDAIYSAAVAEGLLT